MKRKIAKKSNINYNMTASEVVEVHKVQQLVRQHGVDEGVRLYMLDAKKDERR